jgi:HK97 family phage portal protein
MAHWWTRLAGGRSRSPAETKNAHQYVTMMDWGGARWSGRSFPALVQQGFARNPVVYRCVRLISESAAMVPLRITDGGELQADHPANKLLARPGPRVSGIELMEAVYAYLLTAGNAYIEAVTGDGEVRGLFALRPDRMQVVEGRDGWPVGYAYTAGGRSRTLGTEPNPVAQVLHLSLFDPLNDHYGMSPLEAAQQSVDIHNAAAAWNKSLLDNAARPSGALVYSVAQGNLSAEQFERLKDELEHGFSGAANAGRPMVLEGGLDWKTIAMSPRDMDFIEAKNSAAREIALAFGVPPMILGIPGDNTYANLVEANKALWRQTIIPMVWRVLMDMSAWFAPLWGDGFAIEPLLDGIEALSEDVSARWARVTAAGFLSDEEKKKLLGIAV